MFDWSVFWPNLLTAIISSIITLLIGWLIAWRLIHRYQRRNIEMQNKNKLIEDISTFKISFRETTDSWMQCKSEENSSDLWYFARAKLLDLSNNREILFVKILNQFPEYFKREFGYRDEKDAIGLLTTLVIQDAGTKHETSSMVQQAIGPNADNYTSSQPTQLCIPYTMSIGNLIENTLFKTTNTRLSYYSNKDSAGALELRLDMNSTQITNIGVSGVNDTEIQNITAELQRILSSQSTELSAIFSLYEPVRIETDSQVFKYDITRFSAIVEDYFIDYNKNLQRLNIRYADSRNEEEITIQMKSQTLMHTDPLAVHMSYKQLNSQNVGFIIYDIEKIQKIASEEIQVSSQIKLGLFGSIDDLIDPEDGAHSNLGSAIQANMETINSRANEQHDEKTGWFRRFLTKLKNGFMAFIGLVVKFVKLIVNAIVTLFMGIVLVIAFVAFIVVQGFIKFFQWIFKTAKKAWEWLKKAFNNILEACRAFIQKIGEFLKKVLDVIGKAIKWIVEKIARLFVKAKDYDDYEEANEEGKSESGVGESVKLSTNEEDKPDDFKDFIMSSPFMDVLRLKILFWFALLFGTNVGLHRTDSVVTSVYQTRQFNDETAKHFNFVYHLDHIIDVLAGRQTLSGESKFDPWNDESVKKFVNPGMGEQTSPDIAEKEGFWQKIGALFLSEEPLSRCNWVVVLQDDQPNDFDWYFGLRTRLQFGWGKHAIKIPFISEKTIITIIEVIVGFLPVYGLIQDVKDSILEPSPIFAGLARFMIPFDLLECFGEPVSIYLNQVQERFKDGGRGIKLIICEIFDFIRRMANGLKNIIKQTLGGKWAKIIGGVIFVALIAVSTIISFLIPAALWPVFGIAAAFGIILFLILFFCNRANKLVQKNNNVNTWKQRYELDESRRMTSILDKAKKKADIAAQNGSRKSRKGLKRMWKKYIGDFIREKINKLKNVQDEISDELTVKLPHCRTACGINVPEPEVTKWRNVLETTNDVHFRKAIFVDDITAFNALDDDAKELVEFITTELYDTKASDFFTGITPAKYYSYYEDVVNLYGFRIRGEHYVPIEKIVIGARLQTRMEDGSSVLTELMSKYSKELNIPEKYQDWRMIFTCKGAEDILDELSKKMVKEDYTKLLDEIIQSFEAKHLFVVNSITDTNLRKLVDIASEDFEIYSYYWLKRAGITSKIQKFDLTPQVYEPYMKTWRKLHFDLDTDSRVKMYNNIKNLDGVTDVRIITGNEALEELMSHPDINLRIINKNNGIDDIAIIHWVDAEGEPHFVSLVDTYKGGAKGNPLSSHKKHIYDNTIDGVDQAGRKYYEKATEVRQEFLKENLLKQEYEVLIKWRQDSQMLDELIYYRTTHCLDSRATDGIAKIGIPVGYTGGGGSNFLFLTTYHTVYGSDHYVQRAIIELFDNNIANWNEDLYKAFVHAETEKIMLGYVKELQMEELVLTGRMTEVGEILDDGTIKYFDEKGRLLLRTDNRQVLTIEEMAVRFINPADGGKTSSLLIDQQFLQPQIRNMGIWDGQEWITRPRVAWNDLPTEISDISWLEIKIEEIQQQIGKELGFDNYHFEYQIVSLDLIERIQREAAAMFQERLIKEGLIEGIYSSGTSSGWQVTVIGLSNDLHPAQITRWIEESSWYYGMKNYENIIFIEDGVNSETVFKQGTDSGHGLVSLTRGEREIFLENLPFRVTSAWCAGLDPHAYKRELQSAIYHFQDSYKLHTNAIAAGNKALAKEYKNTCELIIERIYELEGIIKIRISYTRKASLAPIHKWKEWIDDYITSSGLKPKKAISTSNYNSYQQDSYSNITNSRFNSIISFMDKEGKYIEINGERVNIQFNWRDLFEKTSNPLYKYGGNIGLYLLLPPGETYTSSSNTLFDWDSIEDSTGAIDNDVLQDFRNTEDIWSIDNIHMETEMFKQVKHIDSYRQKQAWVNYLIQKGYSTEIIDWVKGKNHRYHPLQPDSNSKTATLAISAITHEYMSILREFKVWIVRLLFLRDSVFKIWEESSLTLEDVWGNFKFKTNGIIKAWHDNAELTYDGLKKKEIVSITFIDFMSYEYLNGTEDWTYISEPYVFGGYNSGIEQYVNTLTQQGMKWMMINSDNTAKILKLCRWLTKNIFSIAGVL